MTVNSFPTYLQPILQTGFLQHGFQEPLKSKKAFRQEAMNETFTSKVGETITKTRHGLKAPRTTIINGSSNTNLDNGLTPSAWPVEQYVLTLNEYGDSIDLNLVGNELGIADQFITNNAVNAEQANQTLERLAAAAFYNAANWGRTYVIATSTNTTVRVNDVTGFQTVWVNGVPTAVSGSNPLTIVMGPSGNTYNVTGVAVDGSNVSTAQNSSGVITGKSGTLTLSAAAATGDAAFTGTFPAGFGTSVVAATATTTVLPGTRANASYLASGDLLTQKQVLAAVAAMRNNGIPTLSNGTYGMALAPTSMLELFSDSDFKLQFSTRGYEDPVYKNAKVSEGLQVTFLETTEAPSYTLNGNTVYMPILFGKDALVESHLPFPQNDIPYGMRHEADGAMMVIRQPLDRLGQIIAQSWYSAVAFACPTDTTTTPTIVPTASNAAYKRIVQLMHT